MASLIMHIVTSKIIAEKYNLSDKFIAGSVMPDIYSKCDFDRDNTHFIDKSNDDLPNYQEFLQKYSENIKDELVLGYAAHLIEDYVWSSNFKNKYVRKTFPDSSEVAYLKANTIQTEKEYLREIYKDYDNIDSYICNKYNISIEQIKNNISKYYTKYGSREKLNEVLYLHEFDINRKNTFITQEDVNEFIEISKEEVDKTLRKHLLEVNTQDYIKV